jgi:predicted transposase YbfD/YdcC
VALVKAKRSIGERTITELDQLSPATANTLVCRHWGIEHGVQWVLDGIAHKGARRIPTGNAPHIALKLLRYS